MKSAYSPLGAKKGIIRHAISVLQASLQTFYSFIFSILSPQESKSNRPRIDRPQLRFATVALTAAILLLGFAPAQVYGQKVDKLEQWANGQLADPIVTEGWVTGNVVASKAHYSEETTLPYRVQISNLDANTTYRIVVGWDTQKNGVHALDFITSYDLDRNHDRFGHTIEPIDIFQGTSFSGVNGDDQIPIPTPSFAGDDPAANMQAAEADFLSLDPTERELRIWGATFQSVQYVRQDFMAAGATSESHIEILFTTPASGNNLKVMIAWGANIASQTIWGAGNSASAISGSPYHTFVADCSGSGMAEGLNGCGNKEVQLQAAAVIITPDCHLSGSEEICETEAGIRTFTATSANADPDFNLYSFSWKITNTNGSTATFVSNNGTSIPETAGLFQVDVNTGSSPGDFTVEIMSYKTLEGGFVITSECDATVKIWEQPVADAGPDQGDCDQSNFIMAATTPSVGSGVWSTNDGSISIANPLSPTTTVTGLPSGATATLTWTVTNGECIDSDDVIISNNGNITTSAGPDQAICDDDQPFTMAADAAPPGGTGEWTVTSGNPANVTITDVNDPATTVTLSDSGPVTLTWTVTLGSCGDSDDVVLEVNPALSVAVDDKSICLGESIELTAVPSGGTAPYSYLWSTGETTQSITVAPGSTTNYSVTVTDAFTSSTGDDCTAADDATVTVNPALSVSVDDKSICLGESIELTAVPSGGTAPYSYLWSTGETTQSITVAPGSTTNYSVTVTDAFTSSTGDDCTAADDATVTVNPALSVAVDDKSICLGESIELTAVPSGGTAPYSYLWSTGETTQSITVAPGSTTNYSVTVTDAFTSSTGDDCTAADDATVTVNPALSVAVDDKSICLGESIELTAVPSGGTAPYSYLWSTGETTQSITVAPGSTTNYSVTVTDAFTSSTGDDCTAADDATVTVNPALSVSVDDKSICLGESIELTAVPSGGTAPYSYLWSTGETTQSITVAPGSTTNYSVTVTDAFTSSTGDDCTAADDATVTVNPALSVSVDDKSICLGESIELTAVPSGGTAPYSYLWSTGETTQSITVAPGSTTNYSVTVTDAFTSSTGDDCTAADDATVTVNPALSVAVDDKSICLGESIELTAVPSGGTAPYSYLWSTGETTQSITVAPGSTTNYSVTVTDAFTSSTGDDCTAADDATVTVNPALSVAVDDKSICLGESIELTAVPSGGTAPYSYLWSTGETTQSITVAPGSTTNYSVTVTDAFTSSTGDDCTAADDATVTVNPALSVAVDDKSICLGESIELTAVPSGGTAPYSYLWSTGETTQSITVAPGSTTNYSVTVTDAFTSSTGDDCTAADDATVTVNPALSVAVDDKSICLGESIELTAVPSGGTAPYSYLWSTGETTQSITVAPGSTTNYSVTVTDAFTSSTGDDCTAADDATVTVNPALSVAVDDKSICLGESIELTAVPSGGTAPYSYLWSTGETTQSITVAPGSTTNYSVTVTDAFTSSTGDDCTAADDATVTVNPALSVAVDDKSICLGESIELTAVPSGGTAPYSYLWSTGETTQSITVAPGSTTNYSVTVTDAFTSSTGDDCTAADDATVTVNPALSVAVDDKSICLGESIELTAVPSGGTAPYSYLWSTGETTQSITVAPGSTTNYSVTVTDAFTSSTGDDCTAADDATVTVNPALSVAVDDKSICLGESIELTAVPSGGTAPYSYLWSTGETTQSITVAPGSTTNYSVTVTDAFTSSTGDDCTAADDATVTVNPALSVAVDDKSICLGESIELTAVPSGGTAPYSYLWSTGETTQSITVAPGSTTNYSVTVTDAFTSSTGDDCTAADDATVTVNPALSVAVDDKSICLGESIELTAVPSGGTAPYSYLWSTGETTQSITVAPGSTTNYSVTVTDAFTSSTGDDCTAADDATVTVNPALSVSVDDKSICLGESIELTAVPSGGTAPYSYLWSTGETTQSITVAPGSTTNYSVTVTDAFTSSTRRRLYRC